MTNFMQQPHFALTIIEDGRIVYDEAGAEPFETVSAIKSALGSLALEAAFARGHDPFDFSLSMTQDHFSNGAGTLREEPVFHDDAVDSQPIGLSDVLRLNIVQSDCVATNLLIDYLGGKAAINDQLADTLHMEQTYLVTDRLHFPGVDHAAQPYQVGVSTMRGLATYYQTIWGETASWQPLSPWHEWHGRLHDQLKHAQLLGIDHAALPIGVDWRHKTGSALDVQPGNFYGAVVDAGRLRIGSNTYFIGAAATVSCVPSGDKLCSRFLRDFADHNLKALGSLGIAIAAPNLAA